MIVATGLSFPEGPAIDRNGRLFCCSLTGGYVAGIGPDGLPERFLECPRPNGLAIDPRDGSFWVADSGCRAILRDGRPVTAGLELLGPNDLVFAPDGTLYFTDPLGSSAENPIGAVYRLGPDGRVERLAGGLAFPNGLALVGAPASGAGPALIIAETLRHRLLRLDLTSGALDPFCDVGRGPDGMAAAPDGRIYVALYREGCIAVVSPTGQMERKLPVADAHPTNCCLDGPQLFVTLAQTGRIQRITLA